MIDDVNIYLSDPDEGIARLAQLDSAKRPSGRVLVAAVGGEPIAAVPLQGGPAIADPFRRTAELVSLLEMRVAQLNAGASATRFAGFRRLLRPAQRPRAV